MYKSIVLITAILWFSPFLSNGAQAQDAFQCVKVGETQASGNNTPVPEFTNTCSKDIEFFWCMTNDIKRDSKKCDEKSYYRYHRHLKPQEIYTNSYSFPTGATFEYGACYGKYYKTVLSGAKPYGCIISKDDQLEACQKDLAKCSLDKMPESKFNVKCKDGTTVKGSTKIETKGNAVLVTITTDDGVFKAGAEPSKLRSKINQAIAGFCTAGVDTSLSKAAINYLKQKVFIELVNKAAKELETCIATAENDDEKKKCHQTYQKNRSAATGVRG